MKKRRTNETTNPSGSLKREYEEMDKELPGYVADIARTMGVKPGTYLPPYIYQIARMCFRFWMRTQRKLDHPDQHTATEYWDVGGTA